MGYAILADFVRIPVRDAVTSNVIGPVATVTPILDRELMDEFSLFADEAFLMAESDLGAGAEIWPEY
ncbi:hypothetical protein AB0N89_22295 [Amycolatopsis sp. NPDC089917]|uniref:hypothetical protein n=1 Tax=Amycolatopsis sp. NPDC089917 TaxID=3155187 RepID=UPI003447EE7F